MATSTIAIVLAAFFVAAFLKGITGLGFSTICLGLLASVIDIKLGIALVLVPSLTSNVMVMVQAGRFTEAFKRFWPVYALAMPGVLVGLWLLARVESALARGVLGAVLAIYGAWGLWQADWKLDHARCRLLDAPVGFVTGVINGLTGSQVMPVLPYLFALRLEKDLFVQAINQSFTLSSLVMLIGLGRLELLTLEILGIATVGIAAVGAGIFLGGKVRHGLSEARFRTLVLALLVLLGLGLMVRS